MLELEDLDLSNSDNTPVPISKEITPRSYKVSVFSRRFLAWVLDEIGISSTYLPFPKYFVQYVWFLNQPSPL